MVILKKIRASTLIETLVASVLIVVTFMLASLILNSTFSSIIKSETRSIKTHLSHLEYLHLHKKLTLPYSENYNGWEILIDKFIENDVLKVEFEAIQKEGNKTITRIIVEN